MTIKHFAALCRCSTQTLRYYDRIGLLKPCRVDQWTGYRHYETAQALNFVKIKHLQEADFSISEIKELLRQPDEAIYRAFDEKIYQQTQKLERIRAVQRTYLREKSDMEKIIQSMSDFILSQLSDCEGLREFGLTPEDGPRVVEQVRVYLETMVQQHGNFADELTLLVDDQAYHGADAITERIASLDIRNPPATVCLTDNDLPEEDFSPDQYETLWETHGWAHVYEWLDRMPALTDGGEYCFWFQLNEGTFRKELSFGMFMLGAVTLKKGSTRVIMSCSVERSTDEQNHFSLLRRL